MKRRVSPLLTLVMLAGCSQQPEYVRPEQALPAGFVQAAAQAPQPLPEPPSRWWRSFGSPELDGLVERALANNHDLKIAVHRIAQAEARAGVAAGALLPTLQGSGRASASAPKDGVGQLPVDRDDFSQRLYQVGVEARYELDLWGKNRSAMDAALATAQASVHDRETVATTLISDVVTTYFQYLQACDRRAVAQANVANMQQVLKTVTRRKAIGEGTDLEIEQQLTALHQAEAVVPVLELQRVQALDKLALLLGTTADQVALTATTLAGLTVPQIAPGLPSELLLRRPDIRKAEADLVAANANIGVARAKLFPSVELVGGTGYGSQYLSSLLSPTSFFWSLAANMAQTIFDNGKTRSEIAFSEARKEEMVETYRKAILAALRDTEDALAAVKYTDQQEKAQQRAVANARNAVRLSRSALEIGMTNYLSVLDTERTQYQNEDNRVQARYARMNAAIFLFKALGGGMALDSGAPDPDTAAKEARS